MGFKFLAMKNIVTLLRLAVSVAIHPRHRLHQEIFFCHSTRESRMLF